MAKKRIYVPVDDDVLSLIKILAMEMDRSEAWVASHLMSDGISLNAVNTCTINPNADIVAQFKKLHS